MAQGTYTLYEENGITPIVVPRPTLATWEVIPRGTFANGVARVALGKKVIWTYSRPIRAAEYQALVVARRPGRQTIETWKRPEGGVAGQFVICTAIMDETVSGTQIPGGNYVGVSVTFTDVREA